MFDSTFGRAFQGVTIEEAASLAAILESTSSSTNSGLMAATDVEALWDRLSYYGSNNLAYLMRGGEGVGYPEIVRDVCSKQRVSFIRQENSEEAVAANEAELFQALFLSMYDKLSKEEQKQLLEGMQIDPGLAGKGGGAALVALFAGRMTGFALFEMATVVANFVARALLGRGLTFAANATLTRTIGLALGPVGWIASGAWFAIDIAGPAYRKTVPAVVQVAALRQLTRTREIIGVVGHGSTGKDSCLKHVFGIETGRIHPIPGSTNAVKLYDVPGVQLPMRVMNFPGFGDLNDSVEQETRQQLQHVTLAIYLFNGNEIPKREEVEAFRRVAALRGRNGPLQVIPVLNKWDKADEDERTTILSETKKRLGRRDVICSSFKTGKPFLESGVLALRERIGDQLAKHGSPPPWSMPT